MSKQEKSNGEGASLQGFNQDQPNRPQSMQELIATMTPEIYENLRSAVELGKWQDGSRLSARQLEHCMEAVILYEAQNLPPSERTGAPLKQQCESADGADVQPLTFTDSKQ